MEKPLQVFCCYAREDQAYLLTLKKHLRPIQREGLINVQADVDVSPGEEWEQKISHYLNTAQIILLLISPDFMYSDYCYSKEMMQAMERHEGGDARVIPIILRPIHWQRAPFGKLQVLPTNAEPVISKYWHTHDDAFFDVMKGIEKAVEELIALSPTPLLSGTVVPHQPPPIGIPIPPWMEQQPAAYDYKAAAQALVEKGKESGNPGDAVAIAKALSFYDQAIRLDPENVEAYGCKVNALTKLSKYEEALAIVDQEISLNPKNAAAYYRKGRLLAKLGRYKEALAVFNQGIIRNPWSADAYDWKGYALQRLGRYEEALAAYNQWIRLNPNEAVAYRLRGDMLQRLGRYEEAVATYDQAINLKPDDSQEYRGKGEALQKLGRNEEAEDAFELASQYLFSTISIAEAGW